MAHRGPRALDSAGAGTVPVIEHPRGPVHTLEILVTNNETYSGLLVSAKLTGRCAAKPMADEAAPAN